MCMFSLPVADVESTQIYARHLDSGEQALVYSMNVKLTEPTAMILPLPVPPNPGDDAVRFVDLSGYPTFFSDLLHAFPVAESRGRFAPASGGIARNATLKVHKVGAFVASFVPSLAEFSRLDERFQLPAGVWSALPYDDWGFAVFQLEDTATKKKGLLGRLFGSQITPPWISGKRTIHPMAFVFPRRDPRTLYFPTMHVHDGAVHPTAEFDHFLYAQPCSVTAASFSWERSASNLGASMDPARAQSLIDPDQPVHRKMVQGRQANRDIMLTPPPVSLETLRPPHSRFELQLHAYPAYFDDTMGEPGATQRKVALHHLETLSQQLVARIEQLLSYKGEPWRLANRDDALPLLSACSTASRDGGTEWKLTAPGHPNPWGPGWRPPTGPGRVRFGARHDCIGSVSVVLSFREPPTSPMYTEIDASLQTVLADAWTALEPALAQPEEAAVEP